MYVLSYRGPWQFDHELHCNAVSAAISDGIMIASLIPCEPWGHTYVTSIIINYQRFAWICTLMRTHLSMRLTSGTKLTCYKDGRPHGGGGGWSCVRRSPTLTPSVKAEQFFLLYGEPFCSFFIFMGGGGVGGFVTMWQAYFVLMGGLFWSTSKSVTDIKSYRML